MLTTLHDSEIKPSDLSTLVNPRRCGKHFMLGISCGFGPNLAVCHFGERTKPTHAVVDWLCNRSFQFHGMYSSARCRLQQIVGW